MKKYLYLFISLLCTCLFGQSTITFDFFDLNSKGNSELNNLKLNQNSLFFKGKEIYTEKYGRYDFLTNSYTMYNFPDTYNSQYILKGDRIIYLRKNSDTSRNEIYIGQLDGSVERIHHDTSYSIQLIESPNAETFYFISYFLNYYPTPSEYRLYKSDGTVNGTQLITSAPNLQFIAEIEDILYFKKNGTINTYNTENQELNVTNTVLNNPYFILDNTVYNFGYNYTDQQVLLYKLNDNLESEYVSSFSSNSLSGSHYLVNKIGNEAYLIPSNYDNREAEVLYFNSETSEIKKVFTNSVKIGRFFTYGDDFYINLWYPTKSYKINKDTVTEFDFGVPDNAIGECIVYKNYLLISSNQIYRYNFDTQETVKVEVNGSGSDFYSYLSEPFIYNEELYFVSHDEVNDGELFKYNLEFNKIENVFNLNTSEGSYPTAFTNLNTNTIFKANENKLFKHDIETNSIIPLVDKNNNPLNTFYFDKLYTINNVLLYPTDKFEMGFTDGTPEGSFVYDYNTPENENYLQFDNFSSTYRYFKDKLFFVGETKYKGSELWVTDGTKEGTYLLKDFIDGYEGSNLFLHDSKVLNDVLYFTGFITPGTSIMSMIETDGTTQGTKEVLKFDYNDNSSIIGVYQNKLLMSGRNSRYYLFDPITKTKIVLENLYYYIESVFVINDRIYISTGSSLAYLDDNFQEVYLMQDEYLKMRYLTTINNIPYVYSAMNGHIYTIENNTLNLFSNEHLFYDESTNPFKIYKDNIYQVTPDNYSEEYYLKFFRKNQVVQHKLELPFIGEYNSNLFKSDIINDKLYLSYSSNQYGAELYIADISTGILSNQDQNLNTIKFESNFVLYPNPSNEYFAIQSKSNTKDKLTIQIFDLQGKLLQKFNTNSNEKITIHHLPKGVYFIHIDNGLNKENKKLIIQ